jgi:hypothetical protein
MYVYLYIDIHKKIDIIVQIKIYTTKYHLIQIPRLNFS